VGIGGWPVNPGRLLHFCGGHSSTIYRQSREEPTDDLADDWSHISELVATRTSYQSVGSILIG
jgi:hypothetical protein